ncbi:hypothetical protein ACW5XW_01165 [Aeromonas piscicola]|uniref:hypothetical protein n=1 Tax=Aeromonas piscicola TaxID=600645 RepID=UPI0012E0770A|nr:hypothetical protein [Aeromonas piscicola]
MELFGSLATIVGLICNFKSEQRASSDDEYKAFLEWLSKKRHKTIISEINSNHMLGLGIKSLLHKNHETLILKLTALDSSIAKLTSKMEGFEGITQALSPESDLSEQAIFLLKSMNTKSSYILAEVPCYGKVRYGLSNNQEYSMFLTRLPGSGFTQSELRWLENIDEMFIYDDIEQLVSLGLISIRTERYGGRSFRITRVATQYLNALN